MCGIAGIVAKYEDKNSNLRKMLDSMLLRGPDDEGAYSDDDISLGHRRLEIIDLTIQANQPMSNENNDILIIHNGEIYNFKDLRQELGNLGHRFKSHSDTEVILHSYEEWQVGCLSKLRGMFAFAIWNKKKKELFLARDRLGIKPLYYYFHKGYFVFASQVRALLASELIDKRLNYCGLVDYLDCGGLKEPQTLIEGIYSLLPGHYAVLKGGQFKIVNYWDFLKTPPYNSNIKLAELNERIKFMLNESVALHLISDVPLGIFLSGGIDSSSLLSLMAKTAPKIKSVSLVFKEKAFNEDIYSRLIAKKYRTEHQEVVVDENYLLRNLPLAISAMDEPTFDGINIYFVAQAAKQAGLTVALSGLGGDEVFAGYSSFRRIDKLIYFCKFWNKSPRLLRKVTETIFKKIIPPTTRKDKIIELLQNAFPKRHPYFWMRKLFTKEQKKKLLKIWGESIPKETDGLENLDLINQLSFLELTNYTRDILLRDTDFMSMTHSLEVRVPFLDHKLVEFMLSVPGRLKMKGCLNKPLLVRSLNESLPDTIVQRKKMGFVFPFEIWLRRDLRTEAERTLREKDSILDEFLNPEAVLKIWQGFLKRRIYWQRPWALYVLKKWVKTYLE